MRLLLVLAAAAACCAGPAAALEAARGLAASGAARLALDRVEALQPREPFSPRWAEWEALRLELLETLGRSDETLKRAAALPPAMPPEFLRRSLLVAARTAAATGQGALARSYAARVTWHPGATPEDVRRARLAVIDSLVAEQQGENAFRAMLRFEQDYRPVERAVAERFVVQLLALGLEQQGVNWLASLGEGSATKLRLQLRTGLAAPDAVIAQARAQLAKGGEAGYWLVLAEAAQRAGSTALQVEALERLLYHEGAAEVRRRPLTEALWKAYFAEAQAVANQNQLLAGDDTAWVDFAARRLGASAIQSRALFAQLVRGRAAPDTRRLAQLQLVFSLYQDGLDLVALRLIDDGLTDPATLDAQARRLLGTIAEAHHVPAAAVRYWRGLAPPPDMDAEEWQIRLAAVEWRSGAAEAAAGTVRALAKSARALPEPAGRRAIAWAQELSGAGQPELAGDVLLTLLPLAGGAQQIDMLLALGAIAEGTGRYARAAEFYLRAVLVAGAGQTEPRMLEARFSAAVNLARAGYRDDARAHFQWLVANAKDPARVAAARRELSRL
jgi:hypothetical protein